MSMTKLFLKILNTLTVKNTECNFEDSLLAVHNIFSASTQYAYSTQNWLLIIVNILTVWHYAIPIHCS